MPKKTVVLEAIIMDESTNIKEGKKLYPYQENAVKTIIDKFKELPQGTNLLFQLPTGGGKTVIFTEIAKRYIQEFNKRVLILTHRVELSKQTSGQLNSIGITNKIINADVKVLPHKHEVQAYTALVETLNNRLTEEDPFLDEIGLVIVDEAHINSFRKLYRHFTKVNMLGVTATPLSSNKKLPLYEVYKELIVGESISDLISQSYLSEGKTINYEVNLSTLRIGHNGEFTVASSELLYSSGLMLDKVIDAYIDGGIGKKTLIFNSGIITSRMVCQAFEEKKYPVKHLDSTFSDKERVEVLDWFRNTPDAILTSVSILTTGFDEPSVETIVLNRATKSLTLYHQMIGRGSRVWQDKREFTIVDLGNNSRRFGLWQSPIDWNHVFKMPHLYIEARYKDEWDYEMENDYEMPAEIKERFLNSYAQNFIVRDKYYEFLRKGLKPIGVIELSLEEHFKKILDNSGDQGEAFELMSLLDQEIRYRVRQYGKCINATLNFEDYLNSTYNSKLRRKLINWFAEMPEEVEEK